MKEVKRGDIYIADLRPVIGSEQGGIRPVVIIQNDIGNHNSNTVIAAVISTRKGSHLPTHIPVSTDKLFKNSFIFLEQIRTIDKVRLFKYLGNIKDMTKIDNALMISLGLG